MTTHTSRIIHATAERLWDILTTPHLWTEWGPSITHVSSSDSPIILGTRGVLKLSLLPLSVPFVITEYTHLKSWSWKVAGLPATTHTLRTIDPFLCEVTFGVPSPLLAPYLTICNHALKKIEEMA